MKRNGDGSSKKAGREEAQINLPSHADALCVGGSNITAMRLLPRRGQRNRLSCRASGNTRPRVHTSVSSPSVVVRCDAPRRRVPRRGEDRLRNPFIEMTRSSKKRCRPDSVPGKVGFAPGHCELAKPALLIVRFEKVDWAQVRRMDPGHRRIFQASRLGFAPFAQAFGDDLDRG